MALYEGLIIQKNLHQERNLVCQVLLRSGRLRTFYLYGGRGGGKRSKGSVAEVGHLVSFETGLVKRSVENLEILNVKEYKLKWSSQRLRLNHQAFYLICLCFEIIRKSTVEQRDEQVDDQFTGFFSIASNLLFYADKAIEKKQFKTRAFFFNFLIKVLGELGTLPNMKSCPYCEVDLRQKDLIKFDLQHAHFTCYECLSRKEESLDGNKQFFEFLKMSTQLRNHIELILSLKTQQFEEFPDVSMDECSNVLSYLCYQSNISLEQLKSWEVVKSF